MEDSTGDPRPERVHRENAFLSAVRCGKLIDLETMFSEDPSIMYSRTDVFADSALHLAARNGSLELVKWILSTGKIPAEIRNGEGDTPLHHAARNGHAKIVELLIEANPDVVRLANARGKTARDIAHEFCQRSLADFLDSEWVKMPTGQPVRRER